MRLLKAPLLLLGLGALASVRAFYDLEDLVETRELRLDALNSVDPLLYGRAGE